LSFTYPALAALAFFSLPVAFAAQRMRFALDRRRARAYSNLAFMTDALAASEWPVVALDFAFAAAFSLMLAACAGPHLLTTARVPATVAICLDTSGSMRLHDVDPTRAAAAAQAVRSFVSSAPADMRIGLVSFAGEARKIAAPTNDRRAFLAALAKLPEPNGQTAIGSGLAAAAALLPDRGARAIVLITDGANNHGEEPRAAVERLAATHVRLNAIAIGNAFAAAALKSYAERTGGTFAQARDAEQFSAEMRRLAIAEFAVPAFRDFTVPFALAALCAGAAAWLAAAGAGARF